MKDAFVAVHGHFYQPPRENPWIETIETEESARPYHDWNERIASECYRPNAHARVVDSQGKILDIVNNYSFISFNFGPTLFRWLEKRFPEDYQKILEADQDGLRRFGHGNAMAQVYDHIILPLANKRDKETEVLWGIADFEKRFGRRPEAIWLPETAVNQATLQVLVDHGMQFLILSPFQALRVRPFGGRKWTDVSSGKIDPSQPYRCFVKNEDGKKASDRFIDLFFYDGAISREASFGDLLKDGNAFCESFLQAYQPSKGRPQMIHIATDGETYGHHKKFGEMALAYALAQGFPSRGMEMINHGSFLSRFPPVDEVEIDEGPKGEGTSWSCSHGVGRWKEDCGCSTGGGAGWNQRWRKPLRESLDLLRDELGPIFERDGGRIFEDPWGARDAYIDLILDRSTQAVARFFEKHGIKGINEQDRMRGLKLLEMERHALQMYTSCGWFFSDLSGIETLIVLQHAGRALQLAAELTGQTAEAIEEKFLEHLSQGRSNLPELGNGREIYERLVRPKSMTLEKVVNHFAISSLLNGESDEKKIFLYRVEKVHYERVDRGSYRLALGQVRLIPEIIPEPKEFLFGVVFSKRRLFRTWVSECKNESRYDDLKQAVFQRIGMDETEIEKALASFPGMLLFTIRDILQEERRAIFQNLIEKELSEHRRIYGELFDKTREVVEVLAGEGLEIPYEIRVAADVTLSNRLLCEIRSQSEDDQATVKREEIDKIIQEAGQYGYRLQTEGPIAALSRRLNKKMSDLRQEMTLHSPTPPEEGKPKASMVDEVIEFLHLTQRWGFELRKEEAQNLMDEMLKEYVWDLEKSWWGSGDEKPFPPNLLVLAEKLGFNVDRFSMRAPAK